jgi:hypothetical protein
MGTITMRSLSRSLLTKFVALLLLCTSGMASSHAASSLTTEAIINLPRADAWALFTTEAGLKSLGYTQARVELRLDGSLQASGGAVPLTSLNSGIISLDSEHMLSFKPVAAHNDAEWTVLYFTAMGKDMTQLRWLDCFAEEQRTSVNQHQQQVRLLFDQLIRRYAPECAVCKLEKAAAK